jgi:hypothetical protein
MDNSLGLMPEVSRAITITVQVLLFVAVAVIGYYMWKGESHGKDEPMSRV